LFNIANLLVAKGERIGCCLASGALQRKNVGIFVDFGAKLV